MVTTESIRNAARLVLGSVPSSWNINRIVDRMNALKPLHIPDGIIVVPEGLLPPPATYFLWLLRARGVSYVFHQGSILSEERIAEFENDYPDMMEEAHLTAMLDVANFSAELDITPVAELLKKSVLSISSLYRYIAAQEHSMEFALTDEIILQSIQELRANPYRFFAYGQNAQTLMPILWEDL